VINCYEFVCNILDIGHDECCMLSIVIEAVSHQIKGGGGALADSHNFAKF